MTFDAKLVSDAVYVRVHERLDAEKVESIEAFLRTGDPGRRVVLDFHETRSFDRAALGRLAHALSRTRLATALRGLSEQHYRLLRRVVRPPERGASAGPATADGGAAGGP